MQLDFLDTDDSDNGANPCGFESHLTSKKSI